MFVRFLGLNTIVGMDNTDPEIPEKSDEGGSSSKHVTNVNPEKRNSTLAKRKANLIRKAERANEKQKKKKKSNARRVKRPTYTVEHGEDMLLIISNVNQYDSVWKPKKKRGKKRKTKAKTTIGKRTAIPANSKLSKRTEDPVITEIFSEDVENFDWSQRLPVEVLVKIFELVVSQNGAVPFLCR